MTPDEEIREWLNRKRDQLSRYCGDPKYLGTIVLPFKPRDIAMFDALLAILAERERDGVSEEERKRLAEVLYSWWSTYDFSEIHKENYDKIRALILSGGGKG